MPHGDRSRGKVSEAPSVDGTGAAAASGTAGMAGEPTEGVLMAGAEGVTTVGGVSVAGCVCAEAVMGKMRPMASSAAESARLPKRDLPAPIISAFHCPGAI